MLLKILKTFFQIFYENYSNKISELFIVTITVTVTVTVTITELLLESNCCPIIWNLKRLMVICEKGGFCNYKS